MKNYICKGKNLEFTAGADYVSGDPVVIGEVVAICTADVKLGAVGVATREGAFLVKKKTSDVIAQGVKVYWDPAAKELTVTAGSLKQAGYAYEAAGASVESATVVLLG